MAEVMCDVAENEVKTFPVIKRPVPKEPVPERSVDRETIIRYLAYLKKHPLTKSVEFDPVDGVFSKEPVKELINHYKSIPKREAMYTYLLRSYKLSNSHARIVGACEGNRKIKMWALPVIDEKFEGFELQVLLDFAAQRSEKDLPLIPLDTLLFLKAASLFGSILTKRGNAITSIRAFPYGASRSKSLIFYNKRKMLFLKRSPKVHVLLKMAISIPEVIKARRNFMLFMGN